MEEPKPFDRPWPPLTPAQRYHLEVHGYVVVENMFSADECEAMMSELRRVCDLAVDVDAETHPDQVHLAINGPNHKCFENILAASPVLAAYATHPRMVAMAEELLGGEARIVETNAHINRRATDEPRDMLESGFHTGCDVPFSTHVKNGLTHCSFVKTLTTLTDLGPDDGGTIVIPGSHKLAISPIEEIIAAASEDRSLIKQMEAPAGSTMLFAETLIHGGQPVRSDRERHIIITAYGARMYPYWDPGGFSEKFLASVPENLKTLFESTAIWKRAPRYRKLSDEADLRHFPLGVWNERK